MKRRIAWIVGGVALVAAVAAAPLLRHPPRGDGFETALVERGDLQSTVSASGTLSPVDEVEVGSAVSGRILRLRVDFNSRVAAGEVLAEIDPSSFRTRVEQFEAAAAKARATLRQAEYDLARQQSLAAANLVAEAEVERTLTARDQASADLRQVEAQLASAKVDLENTAIRAPIDGVVLSREVDEGQTVAASLQAPTLFKLARDLSRMQVETSVDEADIGRVVEGQDVRFTVDAWPELSFTGVVHQVRLQPLTTSGVVNYTVVIHTRNEDLRLRPGMTADVEILVASARDVLSVPNAALRLGDADFAGAVTAAAPAPAKSDTAVFVLRRGRPERVPVRAGLSDGSRTAVASAALAEGDAVITSVPAGAAAAATAGARTTSPLGSFGPPAGLGRKRS